MLLATAWTASLSSTSGTTSSSTVGIAPSSTTETASSCTTGISWFSSLWVSILIKSGSAACFIFFLGLPRITKTLVWQIWNKKINIEQKYIPLFLNLVHDEAFSVVFGSWYFIHFVLLPFFLH